MADITHVPDCTCLAVMFADPKTGESRFVEWKMVCDACMELTREVSKVSS